MIILNNAHNKTIFTKVIILYLRLSNNKNKVTFGIFRYLIIKM